ncbi:MAG: hypothetical protein JO156_12470 [Solirubrobacterales bacterium]|nr:hypothetical protein [Solirubrobacterales bacterium]
MLRRLFDAFERPLAAASEAWVQSGAFMDLLAVGFKLQRRLTAETRDALERALGVWGVPTRGDLVAVINQLAGLERQLRELGAQARRREPAPEERYPSAPSEPALAARR